MDSIFTVDVEEYYHTESIQCSLPEELIKTLPDRVGIGVDKILDLLARSGNKATFFVLGCLAQKERGLVQRIAAAGHEIASHGYYHCPLHEHTALTFEEDLKKSIDILSGITGRKIIGYRSASFSPPQALPAFFDILKKNGIVYDSSFAFSLFRPGPRIGVMKKEMPLEISEGMLEFPVSFFEIGPLTIPLGGGYFRAYPYWLTRAGLERASLGKAGASLFYIHPWELDPQQPRFKMPVMRYFRHYFNLNNTERKLQKLLSEVKFVSLRDFITIRKNHV